MNTEINSLKARSLQGMRSYMEVCLKDGDGPGYTEEHINKCQAIVDTLLNSLSEAPRGDQQVVMSAVKKAVIALNKLNEECDYRLIETDQREDLAMLMIKAAESVGVGNGSNDITEEWREW